MTRYIIILLFLATAAVLFFVETLPYYDQVKALQADSQLLQEALANSRELQTIRDDLLSKYNAIPADDIGRLNKMLPLQLDSGSLIAMLENRVKSYGFLLKKFDVKEYKIAADPFAIVGAPPPPYKILNLILTLSGPYASFLQLLPDLERSLRLFDIQTINFSGSTGNIIEFTLFARVYAAVSSAPIAAISSEETGQQAKEILDTLIKLKGIKVDADFFKNEVFKSLVDFAPPLEIPAEYGRPNPFSGL